MSALATCGQMRRTGAHVAPHRRDHEPFDQPVTSAPTGRKFVTAREVADVCQLSEYKLDTHYRPADWATPRDFRFTGQGAMLFAVESLPRLADALQAAGQLDAALALREWAAPLIATLRAALSQQGASEAGRSHKPGSDGSTPSPATSPAPESWATKWEREHDL